MKTKHIQITGFFLAVFFALTGCATPITESVIDDIGGNDEMKKFQYYVSVQLVLKATEKVRDQQDITKSGIATITDTVHNKTIIVGKDTMGAMINSYQDDNGYLTLEICFEEDDKKRLLFKKEGPGADRKFHLVYQNPSTRTLDYGGEIYTVSYSGDRPYLNIKLNKQQRQKLSVKWARGRRTQD